MKKQKRHFGKCPDWLAWIWCKRTACTFRRKELKAKLLRQKPPKKQTDSNPIIQMFYELDKK